MMNEHSHDNRSWRRAAPFVEDDRVESDHVYLLELIKVLRPHPAGLRRWSVMRAIRKNREMARLPIPHKMEDAVERVFRNQCADSDSFKRRNAAPETALCHWPQGKLGGVWAVYPDRVEAWLKAEGVEIPA